MKDSRDDGKEKEGDESSEYEEEEEEEEEDDDDEDEGNSDDEGYNSKRSGYSEGMNEKNRETERLIK